MARFVEQRSLFSCRSQWLLIFIPRGFSHILITDLSVTLAQFGLLRGVYMRKLAPARVSYRDDFLISNRVYMMSESFRISLFEDTLHVDNIHV